MKNKFLGMFLLLFIIISLTSVPAWAAEKENEVEKMVSRMSLREKISQMMMVSFRHWDENIPGREEPQNFTVMNEQVAWIVENYNFGAVIYFSQNLEEIEQAYELTTAMQQAAVKNGGIPMLICADQEGGMVYRLKEGTALPGNMALAAAANPRYSYMAGQILGSELSAIGINTNLAPVVDVNSNANNPVIGLRSYGDNPKVVGELSSSTLKGMAVYNVIGCAKHFPGHGDTSTDSHYGLPCVDKSFEELLQCELIPYQELISQGVDMIMTAHILYPQLEKDQLFSAKTGKEEALPVTMSDDIITGLLKQAMGFEGIVVTDAMNMEGITDSWDPVQAIINAISAGVDMICMPCTLNELKDVEDLESIIVGVETAVEKGMIPISRIDDAVIRILKVKQKHGILGWNALDYSLEKAEETVGSDSNREVERQIAAAAVTVVQNKKDTLPLKVNNSSKVLIIVPNENQKAQMLMGWNRAKAEGLIPEGAEVRTICFGKNTSLKTYKKQIQWADTLVMISQVSNSKKMNGKSWESSYLLKVIDYAESKGKTTIVESIDKPYDVQSYSKADAVLAVYGSKGSGIDPTEALVGDITKSEAACGPNITAGMEIILGTFGAKGVLPVDIPKFEKGKYTSEIVYPRGFGITYESLIANKLN